MALDVASATAAAAQTTVGQARLTESFDTFLSLLTTQLKNQDPTAPLDTNQFTEQLVQMTGVEQQLLTNDLLRSLADGPQDALNSAVGYIGKTVTAQSAQSALTLDGADWSYALPRSAASVTLQVLDASGVVVRSEAGELGAGEHAFAWDGKTTTGAQLDPGGVYTLRVTATDTAARAIPAAVTTQGVVRAVEQADGDVRLVLNGVSVPLSSVSSVRQTA